MANLIIQNTIANVVTKIWTILSLYLFVPIWIHFLGVEGYGVISFYTILMTIMHFADAGLTATLTREFARGDIDEQYRRNLLRTIEYLFVGIATILFCFLFVFSGFIVDNFLKSSTFTYEELRFCVQIMALTMSIHFIYSLYSGGLFGLQKQVLANIINICYSVSRSALVILPLLLSPTITTFFLWQLVSIIVSLFVVRLYLIKNITIKGRQFSFKIIYLQNIWKFAFGMMLMAIISALNTQLDKLVTGNVLSLQEMGYYSLASTIGIAVISITQPLGTAIYPELTRLLSFNKKKMEELLLLFTYIVSSISVAIGITLFLYIDEFSYMWTHDQTIVHAIRVPARLLIIGNILQSFQLSAYYLALANGHTKTNVKLGISMLVFMVPSVYLFTKEYGLHGTAIPYVIINVCATLYFSYSIIGRFFKERKIEWVKYTTLPIGVVIFVITIPYFIISNTSCNPLLMLGIGSLFGFIGFVISLRVLFGINYNMLDYIPAKCRKLLFIIC